MKYLLPLILGIIVLSVLGNSFYVVREYEQVIITQFGKPVGDPVATPGLKMKIPFIQKTLRFEKRFLEWDGKPNQLPTKDKRFIWVNTYARWKISDPLLFLQRLRDERGAQTRLDDILDGETRNAIANYNVMEIVRSTNRDPIPDDLLPEGDVNLEEIQNGRGQIHKEILRTAQSRTLDLGIEILDIQFKRINYVDEVQRKVYERMIAERQRIADRFRSEGEGEASRIRGEKDRELLRIQSGAYRTAQGIKGKADAEAIAIYAEAYDRSAQSRSFFEFLKSMEAYELAIDKESSLILSTKGDFYRFLKSSEGK
ncbi:MAG: protease modulator HflC [bacterium]|nr:protease modulator HflC [bacterium]